MVVSSVSLGLSLFYLSIVDWIPVTQWPGFGVFKMR